MPQRLTVIIPTFNVEAYLERQLEGLAGFADEILIVDSFSTDRTQAIAEAAGVRFLQHEYENSARQKNWAIPQASHEWVLILDSDEWLDDELRNSITSFLSDPPEDVDLAWLPRKNLFWGEFLRYAGAYPDRQSRLFRRDKGRYDGREVHSHVETPGQSVELSGHIIHDDFTDISSWWLKSNRYFRYELAEALKQGKRWTIRRQILYPVIILFRDFFWRQGFRHGFPGFFAAFQKALWYFMIQAKLYEHELAQKREIREKAANPY